MAIDNGEAIRPYSLRKADNSVITVRVGVDDGGDFRAGTIVVEEDGVLREATANEAANFTDQNATEAQKAADRIVNSGISTVLGVTTYLKAKFPEDFD